MFGNKKHIVFLVLMVLILLFSFACAKNDIKTDKPNNSDTSIDNQQTEESLGDHQNNGTDTNGIPPITNGGVYNTNNYN